MTGNITLPQNTLVKYCYFLFLLQEFAPTINPKMEIHEECSNKSSDETAEKKREMDQSEPSPKPVNDNCQSEGSDLREQIDLQDNQAQSIENQTKPVAVEKESENNGKEIVSENVVQGKTEDILDKMEKNGDENLKRDLATEDEYWDLWEAVKVDDITAVSESYCASLKIPLASNKCLLL